MIQRRTSEARGATQIDWLDSRHSFSFGSYFDADRVQHGPLRVLNDDRVAGRQGFGAHPHRDAEIVSYVLSGQLQHRDSLGNGSIIEPGQFQYMSAGRGVTHSEFNPADEPVHFLQIWLLPNEQGLAPTYGQTDAAELEFAPLARVASGSHEAPIRWRADADLWLGRPGEGESVTLSLAGQRGYLHVTRGLLRLDDGSQLTPGDALAVENEQALKLEAGSESEFLWFDLQ